jgi:integrase
MEMKLEEGLAGKLKVPNGKRDLMVFDTETPGFFLRKFSTGRAVYGVKFSVAGKPRKVHLYDATIKGVLAKARKEAGDVRAKARLGTDVVADREEKRKAREEAERRAVNTLAIVGRAYLEAREPEMRWSYFLAVRRYVNEHWKPLHARPIDSITRAEIVEVLNDVERDCGKVAADRALSALGTLFAWAIDKGYAHATPVLHINPRAGKTSRDRTLTQGELREVWLAADAVDDKGKRLVPEDYARIVKLLILTGQRKSEVGGLDWAEITEAGDARIDLPKERTKNRLPHVVPLAEQAMACLPAKRNSTLKVFGKFDNGFSGWGKAKAELDAAVLAVRRKADPKAKAMPGWVVHDLRRTFATQMRELGFADTHLVELIINHVSGTRAGVAGVYDKSERLADRRKALEAWGKQVEKLVRGDFLSPAHTHAVGSVGSVGSPNKTGGLSSPDISRHVGRNA